MIGDDGRVRVMDFGLARSLEKSDIDVDTTLRSQDPGLSSTLTAVGTVLGTPAYMAFEQFGGQQEVGAPADQFAFCVALFEALYGHRPFTGDNLRKLAANIALGNVREPTRRGVPRWLRAVIGRGLSAPQGQRWPGMAALLTRIERGQALARVRAAAMVAAVVGVVVVAG